MTDEQQEQCSDNIRETMKEWEDEPWYTDVCKQILDWVDGKFYWNKH